MPWIQMGSDELNISKYGTCPFGNVLYLSMGFTKQYWNDISRNVCHYPFKCWLAKSIDRFSMAISYGT